LELFSSVAEQLLCLLLMFYYLKALSIWNVMILFSKIFGNLFPVANKLFYFHEVWSLSLYMCIWRHSRSAAFGPESGFCLKLLSCVLTLLTTLPHVCYIWKDTPLFSKVILDLCLSIVLRFVCYIICPICLLLLVCPIHTHRLSSVCWIHVKISPVHVTGLRGDGVQQEGKVMLTQVSCAQVWC
jgi:hypothetical protein